MKVLLDAVIRGRDFKTGEDCGRLEKEKNGQILVSNDITKTEMEVLRIFWPLFSTVAAIFVQVWTVERSLFTLFLDAVEPGSQSLPVFCLFFSRGIVSS